MGGEANRRILVSTIHQVHPQRPGLDTHSRSTAQSAGKTPLENVASRVQSGAGCGCSGLGRSYREREHRPQWRARTPARGDGSGRKDTQKLKQIPGPRPAVSQSSSRARLAEPTSGPARRN